MDCVKGFIGGLKVVVRCSHYRLKCRIRAPCCNEIYDCKHCHNETMNNINLDPELRHDGPRYQIANDICSLCGTKQEVQQFCRWFMFGEILLCNNSCRALSLLLNY